VTERGGWLRHAAEAGRIAADRGDLWLPGALGALPYLAWLPLLLTVAGAPRTSDFAFLGAGLFSSDLFPLNVLLIATLAALGVLLAFLVAALAEATLLRSGPGTPHRPLTRDLEEVFSVMLVAALPAVGAAAAVVSGVAAVAPGEFGSPDLGVPLVLRIALHLVPLLVLLAILAWAGQAVAAVAMRRVVGPESLPIGQAIRAALRDILGHPVRRLGLALVALLADLLAVALAVALLGVLWAPIGSDLLGGELASPSGLLLLVGFVAIWLAIVLAFGALHVWASTWWSLELGATVEAGQPEAEEGRP
jgi:hypothetical protein